MPETISVQIDKNGMKFDFHGFSGNNCGHEANAIRALLEKMGVHTDIEDSCQKEQEVNGVAGRISNGY